MTAGGTRPHDGKGKAPPSAGRRWLVGLGYFAISSHLPAGASKRNTKHFSTLSAIAILARRGTSVSRRDDELRIRLGPHDLPNERVRPAAVAAAVTNAAEPDAKLVVTSAHGGSPARQNGDGAERAEMLGVSLGSASRGVRRAGKIPQSDQPPAPSRRRRFSLAVVRSCTLRPHASRKRCELMRHPAKCRHSHHGGLRSVDLGTNRPSLCGVTFGERAFGAPDFCASSALGSLAELLVGGPPSCCDLAGKSALDQPRCRSSGARGGAVAVSWNAGRVAGLAALKSVPASFGISKSGASFFATDVLTASAKAVAGRSQEP